MVLLGNGTLLFSLFYIHPLLNSKSLYSFFILIKFISIRKLTPNKINEIFFHTHLIFFPQLSLKNSHSFRFFFNLLYVLTKFHPSKIWMIENLSIFVSFSFPLFPKDIILGFIYASSFIFFYSFFFFLNKKKKTLWRWSFFNFHLGFLIYFSKPTLKL